MSAWNPKSRDEVEALLAKAVNDLHPLHRKRFAALRVALRAVPVADCPGETDFAVAEHDGKIIYYSDVDDGWEIEYPGANGGIAKRGSNQFELKHLMWQLFGDPERKS